MRIKDAREMPTLYRAFLECLKKHPNNKDASRAFRVNKREARKATKELEKMGWTLPPLNFGAFNQRERDDLKRKKG